jgi:hypothetical protein
VQHLPGDGFRQITDKIRQIVEFETFGGRDKLLGFHFVDEFLANILVELDEYIALELGVDHPPDELTLPWWNRLEQKRDFCGMQGRDHPLRGTQRARIESFPQRGEPRLFATDDAHGAAKLGSAL